MKKYKLYIKYFSFFIGLLLLFSILWGTANFQIKSFNQVLFTLSSPMSGASDGVFLTWVLFALLPSLAISLVFVWMSTHQTSSISKLVKANFSKLIVGTFIVVLCTALIIYQIPTYAINKVISSDLYETYYVDASQENFVFPTKKKNLIYIFMESMESTFADSGNNGYADNNAIPNLTKIAKDNTNFSNTTGLGGAFAASDTGWTTAGMLAQTSGVTLNPSVIHENSDIAPGVYSLGEVLEEAGYEQTLMFGSDSEFGGRDAYFRNHGNYNIFDLNTAKEKGYIPSDYHTWWGFEDSKLFDYAKIELEELSKGDAPFNLTMLTVNTHNPDGYLEAECEVSYDNELLNSVACSDQQIGEFIDWIGEQEWADDTVIVLSGDHLSMNTSYMDEVDKSKYERHIYNSFINANQEADNSKTVMREFTTLDMFPTTLAALGVSWSGDRLGLGTNLYSSTPTLPEEIGRDKFNVEVARRSQLYETEIINNE